MDCDPKRLLESSELSPAERSVLRSARTQRASYDVQRGLARFQATLSVPAQASLWPSLLGKLALSALALGVIAGLYIWLARDREPVILASPTERVSIQQPLAAPTMPLTAAEPAVNEQPAAVAPKPPAPNRARRSGTSTRVHVLPRAERPAVEAPVVAPQVQESRPPARVSPPRVERQTAPAASARPDTEVQRDESLDELRATARVRALLGRDPRAALSLLDRLSAQHPQGYFVEERAALRVFALLAADQRDSAAARARDFLRAYPHSPFAAQVRKISDP